MQAEETVVHGEFRATYMIIRGADHRDLAVAVNRRMREGWQPAGGVVYVAPGPLEALQISGAERPYPFHQAMIRD